MKRLFIILILFILFANESFAACTRPVYSKDVNASTRFCGLNLFLETGLVVSKDNVFIDCGSAVLQGFLWQKNVGITIEDRNNVTLVDCRLVNYGTALLIRNSSNIFFEEMTLLRNSIGVHVIDSINVSIVDSFDISLLRPVRFSNSSGVVFDFYNKKIKGDFCSTNICGK